LVLEGVESRQIACGFKTKVKADMMSRMISITKTVYRMTVIGMESTTGHRQPNVGRQHLCFAPLQPPYLQGFLMKLPPFMHSTSTAMVSLLCQSFRRSLIPCDFKAMQQVCFGN
jgi:hypothetical protein